MKHHLWFISEQTASDAHVIRVVGQASSHEVKMLEVPDYIGLPSLPSCDPELNAVERLLC